MSLRAGARRAWVRVAAELTRSHGHVFLLAKKTFAVRFDFHRRCDDWRSAQVARDDADASVFVPYTDPGLKLSQIIRRETEAFVQKHQRQPRVVLMQNHGIIGLGATWQSVLASLLMAEKAAKIFVGAAALGGPVFFSPENVRRISGRPDEAYRQRALKM